MRSLAILSTSAAAGLLLAGCSLYFDPNHTQGGGITDVDGGLARPPTQVDDGGRDGGAYDDGDGGLSCGGPAQPARAAEMQWAACLSVSAAEFQQTQAYQVGLLQSDSGRCYACHVPGTGDIYLSSDVAAMLHAWQEEQFVTTAFIPRPLPGPNGSYVYQMGVNQGQLCAAGTQQATNAGGHPSYDCNAPVNGVDALTALEQFRELVQAKLDAGQCPPPAFATP